MDTKTCTKCKETHPVSDFTKNKSRKDGLAEWCKPCKRHDASKHKLWKLYGLRLSDFRDLWERCGGKCEICGSEMTNTLLDDKPRDRATQAHIDHCHETGKVRGLLCAGCNIGLGNFKDDISLMESAIEYLKATPTEFVGQDESDKQRQMREMDNAMRLMGYHVDDHGRYHEKQCRPRAAEIRARIASNDKAFRVH